MASAEPGDVAGAGDVGFEVLVIGVAGRPVDRRRLKTSGAAASSSISTGSRTSTRSNRASAGRWSGACRSATRTEVPAAVRLETRWLPMKPAPPKTTA